LKDFGLDGSGSGGVIPPSLLFSTVFDISCAGCKATQARLRKYGRCSQLLANTKSGGGNSVLNLEIC
jgi:hypothetical protein